MATYTIVWSVLGITQRPRDGVKWLIFLTNWSYTVLTIHFIVGTFVPAFYYHYVIKKRTLSAENLTLPVGSPRMLVPACKVSWVLFTVAISVAFMVSALFWSVVYDPSKGAPDYITINAHGVNSILALADTLVSGMPVRILHATFPFLYGVTYAIFSVVYWKLGGTDPEGDPYIYSALDYGGHPARTAILIVLFLFAAVPTSQMLLYGLYRLRTWLKITYCNEEPFSNSDDHRV